MPGQGRLGDKAQVQQDAHGCPGCPHPGVGPAIVGSPDVLVNGRPALRVDDVGIHAVCCGPNMWSAQQGSATVFINGKAAYRKNDPSRHCGGSGKLIEGSDDVIIGDATGGGGSSGSGSGGAGAGGAGAGGASAGPGGARGGGTSPGGAGGGGGEGPGRGSDGAAAPSPSPSTTPQAAPARSQLHVRLVDIAGSGLAGQAVRIQLPDGRPKTGTTDGDGRVDVNDTASGACTVSFPELRRRAPGPLPPDVIAATQGEQLARGDATQSFPVLTSDSDERLFQLRRLEAAVFEAEHYHDGGAVLLPGAGSEEVTGIDVLAAILRWSDTHRDQRLLVTGHGAIDAGGLRALAQARADSLLHALTGARAEWAQVAAAPGTLSDLQAILRWADGFFAFGCDVGDSGGVVDGATVSALAAFRAGYSAETGNVAPPPGDVDAQGRAGEATWAACFDLYMLALARTLATDASGLATLQAGLRFAADAPPPAPPPPPKQARPYLLIRTIDQIYPSKIAQIATANANDWRQLNPLNPERVLPNDAGWKNMHAGEKIFLVPAWAPALLDAGYDIRDENDPASDPQFDAHGRPLGHWHLVIQRTDSVWPVKMAEIAVHDATQYRKLNKLNPHLLKGPDQWKDLFVGHQINVPDEQWAQALTAAGFTMENDPPPPSPPPPIPPPSTLGRTVACREHHLAAPFANASSRRALERRGEALFFDDADIPADVCQSDNPTCDAADCQLYDPREYVLVYQEIEVERFELDVFVHDDAMPANPIVAALVALSPPRAAAATSDGAGNARFSQLPRGKYLVTAKHQGFITGQTQAFVGGTAAPPSAQALAPQSGSTPAKNVPIQLATAPSFELFADFNRNGQLALDAAEHDARTQAPGAILLPDLDVDGRPLPTSVTVGPAPTLDSESKAHTPGDPQLLPLVIRQTGGPTGANAVLFVEGVMSNRMSFFDSAAKPLQDDKKLDHFLLPLPTGKTELRMSARSLPGSPLARGQTLSLQLPTAKPDESTLTVSFFTVDPGGGSTDQDHGLFTVAPLLFMHNLLVPERIYVCERPTVNDPSFPFNFGNEPMVKELESAVKAAGGGVALLKVPPAVSGGEDVWLQDQMQVGWCQSPSGATRVVLHLPRTMSNPIQTDAPAANLASFVRSHFPSRNLGLFDDFWKRSWTTKDAAGKDVAFAFADSTVTYLAMGRVFWLRSVLVQLIEELEKGGSPIPTATRYSDVRSSVPGLLARANTAVDAAIADAVAKHDTKRAQRFRDEKTALQARKSRVDKETPLPPAQQRFGLNVPGQPTVLMTDVAIDALYERLRHAYDSVNYGGNLVASPPFAGAQLGKVFLGSNQTAKPDDPRERTADPDLRFFLRAQKQPLVELDTSWLDVGHTDELITFVPQPDDASKFLIAHASPGLAMSLIARAAQLWDANAPAHVPLPDTMASRLLMSGSAPVTHLLRGKLWLHHHPQGAFEGVEPPRIYRKMFDFFNKSLQPLGIPSPHHNDFDYKPGEGSDRYYNAQLSVIEFSQFEDNTNANLDANQISDLRGDLGIHIPKVPLLELPVLFDRLDDVDNGGRTSAFTPNLTNLQVLGNHLVIPRPYGPRMRPDDAVTVVEAALVDRGKAQKLSPEQHQAIGAQLNTVLAQSAQLGVTVHWANGSETQLKANGSTLPRLAELFRDGFSGLKPDQIMNKIHVDNPQAIDGNGDVRPGWQRLLIKEGTVDLFELYTEALFAAFKLKVQWVDTWFYHVRFGELHCGTNVLRRAPTTPTWWMV